MEWFEHFYKKEKWVKKSVELKGEFYDILKKISSQELDASINKIIDACVDNFELDDKVTLYKKERNEISIARSIIIRESMYRKLEEMRKIYGISTSRLINIAIRNGLNSYQQSLKNEKI